MIPVLIVLCAFGLAALLAWWPKRKPAKYDPLKAFPETGRK